MSTSSVPINRTCQRCQDQYTPQDSHVNYCQSCVDINCRTAETALKRCRDAQLEAYAELISPPRKRIRRVFEAQFAEVD